MERCKAVLVACAVVWACSLASACGEKRSVADLSTDPGGEDAAVEGIDAGEDAVDGQDPAGDDGAGEGDSVMPACGNRSVEEGEECDDGNDVRGDGCEPDTCLFTCRENRDCNDGQVCNGDETCQAAAHTCAPGTPRDDGIVCRSSPRGVCRGGACADSTCGDGYVDAGGGESCEPPLEGNCGEDCRWLCDDNGDCPDDGDPCNGVESCDTAAHACTHGTVPEDGTTCGASPRRICIGGTCRESLCGDGVVDGGRTPPEECEDGNTDPGDGCEPVTCRYTCHGVADCEDGFPCTDDTCSTVTHTCTRSTSGSGTVCRAASGACDVAEVCNGSSAGCPSDAYRASGVVCRAKADDCDVQETCNGTALACPANAYAPSGTPCADGNSCTWPDTCDGGGHCTGMASGLHGAVAVAGGMEHTCAIVEGARVKCWGKNSYGQLGNNTRANSTFPVEVAGITSATGLSVGYGHTCAVLSGGRLRCWGNNINGQLGDGTGTDRLSPVDVAGLSAGVTAVAGGGYHTCAVVSTGGVVCWGFNAYGELGDGTLVNRNSPVGVQGLTGGVTALSMGAYHSCALLSGGTVRCWGYNNYGQLGNNTTTNQSSPAPVAGITGGTTALSAGGWHACALVSPGGVRCWGHNGSGQVGDNSSVNRASPVPVAGMTSGVGKIALGGFHSCALLATGSARCWGYNTYGQVGDATTTNRYTPVQVTGMTAGALKVGAGDSHTCAITSSTGIKCWGYNNYGQLGNGTITNAATPVSVVCP